jgi:receptor protein-tyrosine kinase
MSTIERAAARLGSIGKRDRRDEAERAEPSLPAMDPAPTAIIDEAASLPAAAPAPASKAEVASRTAESPGITPTMFVGGGFVDLDVEKLASLGFVVEANVDGELATDFRRIKRPLLLAVKKAESEGGENPANLIVVTSALPGEGKTFTSVNLALSVAAELDLSVLLVDGDVAKSSIIDVLDVRADLGLTDVVARGGTQVADAVIRTNIKGLELMTSGPRLPHTDELFASEQMRRAMHELARQDPSRLVIVDGPPLLARTEAPNLARLAGHVVVVVEADKTPQASVTEALGLLHGCERVSLVLNKVTRRGSDRHAYGYGYAGGHGHAPRGY